MTDFYILMEKDKLCLNVCYIYLDSKNRTVLRENGTMNEALKKNENLY